MLSLGILGAAAVAERSVVRPSAGLEGLQLAGVASSDAARARRFAGALGLPRAWPDYESLLSDGAVGAVYVALHNAAHATWAIRAAGAGKHVLVEKPLCLSRSGVEALRAAASASKVFVMEGVMTAHHDWQGAVRELVRSRELGRLERIETELVFSTPDPSSYRCRPELGGGIFWDAGPYWVQLLQALLGPLAPEHLRGSSDFDGPNGIDARFRAEVSLPDGIAATFTCAFGERHVAEHRLLFEDGAIRHSQFLRPAVAPFRVNLHVTRRSTGARRTLSFPPAGYYPRQLGAFVEGARRGLDPGHLAECDERIGLLEALYADARRRHERAATP